MYNHIYIYIYVMYAKECETNQYPPCIVLSNELLFATE